MSQEPKYTFDEKEYTFDEKDYLVEIDETKQNNNNVTGNYIQQGINLFTLAGIIFIICGGSLIIGGILSHTPISFIIIFLGGILLIGGFSLFR